MLFRAVALITGLLIPSLGLALDSSQGNLTVTKIADGLKQPWGVGHLPGGGILITERAGDIIHLKADGKRVELDGVPRVVNRGQGGLLDVMIPRD